MTVPEFGRRLACGCLLGYERCIECRAGLHPDQETALAISVARRAEKSTAPYGEWCRDPALCKGKNYCPRDPTCGD